MRWVVAGVVLLTLFRGSPARADAGDADEALRLRQASSEDWGAGRFRDAAEKLRRAEAIYLRTAPPPALDLAVTRRALVWNLVKAGELDAAAATFEALRAAAGTDRALLDEAWNAYGAMFEGARDARDLRRAETLLGAIRSAAGPDDTAGFRTQVLHDLGSIALHAGDPAASVRHYEAAIDERRKAGPSVGLAWSLNNLAHLHLERGRLDVGLVPLLEAHRLVTTGGFLAPQATVAVNLRGAVREITAPGGATPAREAWIGEVAAVTAASDLPAVVPAEVLLRARLRAAAGLDPSVGVAAARAVATAARALRDAPRAAVADLVVRAAELATDRGAGADAAAWLAALEPGDGPAAAYVEARARVAAADAAARGKPARPVADVQAALDAARAGLRSVEDRALGSAGLERLAGAADAIGDAARAAAVRTERTELLRHGEPGGHGAAAVGGGDTGRFRTLGAHDVVFELRVAGPELLLLDRLTETTHRLPLGSGPRVVGFHGLVVTALHGFVRLGDLDYGASGAVVSAPATMAVDDLEPYLVLGGTGALEVLRNGAVRRVP